jgi:hypothetical protein
MDHAERIVKCRRHDCGTPLGIEVGGLRLLVGRVTYTKPQELPCGKCGMVTVWHPHRPNILANP